MTLVRRVRRVAGRWNPGEDTSARSRSEAIGPSVSDAAIRSAPRVARGFSPLDEELELGPGAFSPRLWEGAVRLGALIPFEQVGETLAQFTAVEIGIETARALTERAGAALAQEQTTEAERLRNECPPAPAGPPVQQLSADGAMVPLVHGEWAEVKTLAIGTVQGRERRDGTAEAHATELSYFSHLGDAAEFAELALPELHRRGTEQAGRVCAVLDGAEWLQHFVDRYRPDAVRILDFPHAAEHLGTAAGAVFGSGTAEASAWLGIQLHELKHGDPDRVLTAVRALAAPTEEACEVRAGVVSYLEKRRAQIAYAEFQAAGYPIGSGIVESGNKLVVEVRLKGSGMHWVRDNVNPMLALRCALCSGRWEEAWGRAWQGLRRQQAERRCRRRQEKRCAPEAPDSKPPRHSSSAFPKLPNLPPKGTMVDGRPTADHPWRRTTLSRTRHTPAQSAKL